MLCVAKEHAVSEKRLRIEAIDEFRGFSVLLMVLADYLAGPAVVPAWLKHAPDVGLTVIDFIAPMFLVAIGLTFGPSFRRRHARDGTRRTIEHFVTRNLALLGVGALFTVLGNASGIEESPSDWGLLQAIGFAGLVTLLVIAVPARWRWVAGVVLLAVYQVLLDRYWVSTVVAATHGGVQGALGWSSLLILATCLGDLFHDAARGRRWFPLAALLVLVGGVALALLGVAVSKHRVSASYVLITLGVSCLVFWCFYLLEEHTHRSIPLLGQWGQNSLLLYVLHGALLGVVVMPEAPWWYEAAPWWLVVVQAAGMVAVLAWIGWLLDRRHIYIAL